VNLNDDLDIYLADFGISATIKETAKADKIVKTLFDQTGYVEMGMLTDKPQATLKDSDLAGTDTKAATITINGTVYELIKPQPDGAGLTTFGLKR